MEQFKHYQQAARGHIRYVTLAPEHDEGFALTHYLTGHGVVVSIGHSGATYEQAVMAYANGARSMTHVYNGMSPFNHRANGLVAPLTASVPCTARSSVTAATPPPLP